MNHYLIVFDRSESRLLSLEECASSREAMKARFRAESLHRGHPEIEIVVLGARSKEALRTTHARYFEQMKDMAARAVGMMTQQRTAAAGA
ncbi:hypothetical protein [Terrabacter sp. C0L_2]|uniref:hypothetical protein n=1 Tax=Terrabacter sp. C0L_2 TaxID=3108389 RepID=UPI002ED5CCD3|nr:hypothetical protein U5C87_15530 [Terrabacter sp. C0L_2]